MALQVEDLIRKHAKVANVVEKSELNDLNRLVELSKTLMVANAVNGLCEYSDAVVLMQYSADCTPIRLREHVQSRVRGRVSMSSHVRSRELYVQEVFLTFARGGGEMVEMLVYPEPMELMFGKKMQSLCGASLKFLSGQWCHGSRESVSIFHQVMDRMNTMKMRRVIAGHVASIAEAERIYGAMSEHRHRDQIIFTSSGCALHDGHNALGWAWQAMFGRSDALLKKLHICFASFRASLCECRKHVAKWLVTVLAPVSDGEVIPEEELSKMYSALGISADLLDVMASQMHLYFDAEKGTMQISE
eukprot:6476470-Amphidinium_carterae.2